MTETQSLTLGLLVVAFELGALTSVAEAVDKHRNAHDETTHLAWLRRQLKTATLNAEIRRQERATSFPIPESAAQ